MNKKIKLDDLYLGKVDAKNELLEESPDEIDNFLSSFIIPPNIIPEQFQKKKKYFISGLKGTGKTALLRYLALNAEDDNIATEFILFKSNFDDEQRQEFARVSSNIIADSDTSKFKEKSQDFEMIWRWFIYRNIVDISNDKNIAIFQKNEIWDSFKAVVSAPNYTNEKTGIKSIIPALKHGEIEISKNPKLTLNLSWDKNNKSKIKFADLVRKADELFSTLDRSENSLHIYLDELELSYETSKKYKRDVLLIRDLIVTIEKLNAISKKKDFNFCLFAAIRLEVINAIESSGKEINKPMSDFGTQIIWNQKGVNEKEQSLLHIITEKIQQSEKNLNLNDITKDEDIWKKYFPEHINRYSPQEHILHHSWYRPRDIVRLLNIAKEQYPHKNKFSHQIFNAISKTYSTESWKEITEELKTKYKNEEIDAIKRIFYGYNKQYFSFKELEAHCNKTKELYQNLDDLLKKYKLSDILFDLYKIGVIGNSKREGHRTYLRYSFRGDDEILFEQNIILHRALKAFMSI